MFFNVLKAEYHKYWIEIKTYYPDHLVSMVITYFIFSFFFVLYRESQESGYYVGFIYWYLLTSVISEASVSISAEKQQGSLEQLLIKPVRFELLVAAKTLVWLFVNFIKVLLVFLVLLLTHSLVISFYLSLIVIFIITLLGVFGFTLFLVGLTLKYTKTASFESILSYILLFLTGAAILYEQMPEWARTIGSVIPISQGIRLSQQIIETQVIPYTEVGLLLVESLLSLMLGALFFHWIYQASLRNGLDRSY